MGESRHESFEVGEKPKVELRHLPAGHATFLPGEDGKVEVGIRGPRVEDFVVARFGDRLVLRAPEDMFNRWDSFEVTVRMPEGAELSANVAAADVDVEVSLGKLGFNSASGNLRARDVEGEAGANTASGDVRLESVGGKLGVNTASGDVNIGEAKGDAGVNTASGDLRVGSVLADLGFRSASGDLEVESFAGGSLKCTTHTGDARISIPPGRTLEADLNTLTGDIRNGLDVESPPSSSGETPPDKMSSRLQIKTLSGDIVLARAKSA